MPALVHLLCMIVAIPYLLLAGGFVFLGLAIGGESLWGFLDVLINSAAWLLSWGGLLLAILYLAIIALGFFQQSRLLGAIAGAAICLIALVVVVALHSGPLDYGQWLFMLPCVLALAAETYLIHFARSRT